MVNPEKKFFLVHTKYILYYIIIYFIYDEISKFDNVAYNFIRNRVYFFSLRYFYLNSTNIRNRVAKKDKRTQSFSTRI